MKYEITNAKAGISFTVEELVVKFDAYVTVLGANLWRADGWDWRPIVERGKFYTAVTDTGFDVVVALNKYGVATALFSDGSYNDNLSLESLTEIEPL